MKKMQKIIWGKDSDFYGPRDYFRNSLIIRKLRNYLNNVEILDFGCLWGNLATRLAKLRYSVYAFDISKLSLNALAVKINSVLPNIKEIIKIVNSKKELVTLNKKFDCICCGEVLEHLKNDTETVKFFWDHLKNGGICIITVPARKKYWDVSDTLDGHYRRYEKKSLINFLSSEGFIIKSFYCFDPITFLWHKIVFLPVLRERLSILKSGKEKKNNFLDTILKLKILDKLFSFIFYFDLLFSSLNIWNYYLIVGKKCVKEKIF